MQSRLPARCRKNQSDILHWSTDAPVTQACTWTGCLHHLEGSKKWKLSNWFKASQPEFPSPSQNKQQRRFPMVKDSYRSQEDFSYPETKSRWFFSNSNFKYGGDCRTFSRAERAGIRSTQSRRKGFGYVLPPSSYLPKNPPCCAPLWHYLMRQDTKMQALGLSEQLY